MAITDDEVKYIAHLARIDIKSGDIPHYTKNLASILEFVETLGKLDTSAVPPLAHPLDLTQRLRADSVTETNQRERFQAIAPQVEQGLYLVPKVIDEE